MKRLRVLHIIPNFGMGGAEKLVVDLLSNYDKSNFDMAAVSFYAKSNTILEKKLDDLGVKVYYLDKHKGPDVSMLFKINKVVREFKPDIIHTHRYAIRYTLLAILINKIPLKVHTVHNIASKELDKAGFIIQKIAYNYFNFVPVAISNIVKKSIIEFYHIEYVPLIYNGIDVLKYQVRQKQKENKLIRLIHVGRFSHQKNHNLLIDAFKMVSDKKNNVKLYLVGDGDLRKEIEYRVSRLNLADKVEFLGVRDDIPDLLAKSDIFVMSSDWEGLPLVLLEALAAGIPIVSTDVGGVPDIIKNNINGILVKPNDPVSLSKAIIDLIENRELRKKISETNKIYSLKFDIKKTQQEYEKLYLNLYEAFKNEKKI
jgi:glycosyltransferase involved in cell wall biosynthesis